MSLIVVTILLLVLGGIALDLGGLLFLINNFPKGNMILLMIFFLGIAVAIPMLATSLSVILTDRRSEKGCTLLMPARIVSSKEQTVKNGRNSTIIHIPVATFTYNGKQIYVNVQQLAQDSSWQDKIGENLDLYINPNDPHQFRLPEKKKMDYTKLSKMGFLCLAISAVSAVLYIIF